MITNDTIERRTVAKARREAAVDTLHRLVREINAAPRDHIQAMSKHAKALAHDFGIPASERAIWRELVPFITKQERKY